MAVLENSVQLIFQINSAPWVSLNETSQELPTYPWGLWEIIIFHYLKAEFWSHFIITDRKIGTWWCVTLAVFQNKNLNMHPWLWGSVTGRAERVMRRLQKKLRRAYCSQLTILGSWRKGNSHCLIEEQLAKPYLQWTTRKIESALNAPAVLV